jgi:nickel-dependent lactate racemase
MRYEFPYPGLSVELPDNAEIYSVKTVSTGKSEVEIIREALRNPVGSERLRESVKASDKVLIITDDLSRPTPAHIIVPEVLAELAHVPKRQIKFLIALGTHRPMTPAEIAKKLGNEVAGNHVVVNHGWNDPQELHDYGSLPDGTRVILNRHLHEADFVIGVGGIAPHPAAGFSGGGKIVAPGVATEHAVGQFHWQSVQFPQRDVLGVRDNPMRQQIDAIAKLAGLSGIVNVVQDGHGHVVYAVAGDPVEAHRAGCRYALDVFGVKVPEPATADVFVADTHPLDQDLWQGVKAMCALDTIVPNGAAVILVSPAPEGVARQHPEVAQRGYMSIAEARQLVDAGNVTKVAAHNMVQGGRLVRRTRAFLVSPGVTENEARTFGFTPCATPQLALAAAQNIKGPKARIIVLRLGGEICPL